MCLLLKVPAGVGDNIGPAQLKDFFSHNSDGYGFMYLKDGEVQIYKKLGKLDDFIKDWYRFVPYERAVHLRMRTHGDINYANCHPYTLLHQRFFLMHNGILNIDTTSNQERSDTWHYIQYVLKPILKKNPELIHEPSFHFLVEQAIGSTNKLAIAGDGKIYILNEDSGVEHQDMWFSNTYAWSAPKHLNKWTTYYKGGHRDYYENEYEDWPTRQHTVVPVNPTPTTTDTKPKTEVVAYGTKIDFITDADLDTAISILRDRVFFRAARLDRKKFENYVIYNGLEDFWDLMQDVQECRVEENEFIATIEYDSVPLTERKLEVGI